MDEQSVAPASPYEGLLTRIGKIWIWSILLTLSAGALYRSTGTMNVWFMNFGQPQVRQEFLWLTGITGLAAVSASLLALFYLFQFLSAEVLPILFDVQPNAGALTGPELLRRCFGALLFGIGVEAAAYVVGFVLRVRG